MEEIKNLLASPIFWLCSGSIAVLFNIIFFISFRRSESDNYIRLLTAFSTFALVIVGLWYTWETRGLRIQADEQLSEIRNQFRLTLVPDLFPSIVKKDKVKELVMEGKLKQTIGKRRYSQEQLINVIKYFVLMENASNKLAYEVRVYVFDHDTKSYLKSPKHNIYVPAPGKKFQAFFNEKANYIDSMELITDINEEYGLKLTSLKKFIKSKKTSIVLLFFKDVQGNIYLRTRAFRYDDENNLVIHGEVILHELG